MNLSFSAHSMQQLLLRVIPDWYAVNCNAALLCHANGVPSWHHNCDVGCSSVLLQNVLNSLSGTWSFEPINIPRSSLKQASRSSHCYASTASKHQLQSLQRNLPLRPAASAREQQQLQQGLNMLAIDSTIADSLLLSHKDSLGSATTDDAEEIITGTLVRYEQLAQPKGMRKDCHLPNSTLGATRL